MHLSVYAAFCFSYLYISSPVVFSPHIPPKPTHPCYRPSTSAANTETRNSRLGIASQAALLQWILQMRQNSAQRLIFNSLFESLEDRVLFDGVPDATFILPQADAQESVPAQVQNIGQADIEGPRELILVDAGVENSEQLLAEILESRPETAL